MTDEELRALVDEPQRRARVSALALAEAFLARIEEHESLLNAFVTVTAEVARADARRVDEARERGARLPLDGLPIVLKDNIDVAGVRTTVGSRLFDDAVAADDATVVRRLREAGAVVLGKAQLHELVFGATTNNPPPFGACRNPWALDRVPGGSSGGSAAALAADLCVGALGSDTGGSVRIPSSLTGVSGLRPTYGTVSNVGVFHVAWTFDTVGPMARGVEDVAHLFLHMVGPDPDDPCAVAYPQAVPDLLPSPGDGLAGLRVGVPRAFFFDGLDREVDAAVRGVADVLADLGATVREVDLEADEQVCWSAATIIRAEALALHRADYDAQPDVIGEEIRRRFELAKAITGEAVAAAFQHMREWQRRVRLAFEETDIFLTPTTATAAPPIDDSDSIETTWKLTYLTYPWSLAHVPALSVPCGFTRDGLPLGAQLAAGWRQEAMLLAAGAAYQRATDWHRRRPPIPVPESV